MLARCATELEGAQVLGALQARLEAILRDPLQMYPRGGDEGWAEVLRGVGARTAQLAHALSALSPRARTAVQPLLQTREARRVEDNRRYEDFVLTETRRANEALRAADGATERKVKPRQRRSSSPERLRDALGRPTSRTELPTYTSAAEQRAREGLDGGEGGGAYDDPWAAAARASSRSASPTNGGYDGRPLLEQISDPWGRPVPALDEYGRPLSHHRYLSQDEYDGMNSGERAARQRSVRTAPLTAVTMDLVMSVDPAAERWREDVEVTEHDGGLLPVGPDANLKGAYPWHFAGPDGGSYGYGYGKSRGGRKSSQRQSSSSSAAKTAATVESPLDLLCAQPRRIGATITSIYEAERAATARERRRRQQEEDERTAAAAAAAQPMYRNRAEMHEAAISRVVKMRRVQTKRAMLKAAEVLLHETGWLPADPLPDEVLPSRKAELRALRSRWIEVHAEIHAAAEDRETAEHCNDLERLRVEQAKTAAVRARAGLQPVAAAPQGPLEGRKSSEERWFGLF